MSQFYSRVKQIISSFKSKKPRRRGIEKELSKGDGGAERGAGVFDGCGAR
jgi:hypothetical protein